MDAVLPFIQNLPPVSACLMGCTLLTSVLTFQDIISPFDLVFLPNRVWDQPWRLFTTFLLYNSVLDLFTYIQGLMPVQEMEYFYNSDWLPAVLVGDPDEVQFREIYAATKQYRTWDFVYFLFQSCVLVLCMETYLYRQHLPPISSSNTLYKVMEHSLHRDFDHLPFIIRMLMKYVVYIEFLVQLIFIVVAKWDLLQSVGLVQFISMLKDSPLATSLCVLVMLRGVWYVRFLMRTVHKRRKTDVVHIILSVLFTPPWYWVIIPRIKRTFKDTVGEDIDEVEDRIEDEVEDEIEDEIEDENIGDSNENRNPVDSIENENSDNENIEDVDANMNMEDSVSVESIVHESGDNSLRRRVGKETETGTSE